MGKGKGDALRAGCVSCIGDILVTLDADGSVDSKEIPYFVTALMGGISRKVCALLKGEEVTISPSF